MRRSRALTGLILAVAALGGLGGAPPGPALAQVTPPCADGIDNDGDGRIDADEDPGCAGDGAGPDETDPAPVASSVGITRAGPHGCALRAAVDVLPELAPARLFPFGDVRLSVRGRSGAAQGVERSRRLPLAAAAGHVFKRLRPGRYDVTATYLGDPFRLRSDAAARGAVLARERCEAYFAGTGARRVRPATVPIGASQQIYDVDWSSWGARRVHGTGTFPVNDCVPYCAAGSITPRRVAVTLSRKRVCRGYEEYLSLRYRPLDGGVPSAETLDFSYHC